MYIGLNFVKLVGLCSYYESSVGVAAFHFIHLKLWFMLLGTQSSTACHMCSSEMQQSNDE
jgi:hypothetical protein